MSFLLTRSKVKAEQVPAVEAGIKHLAAALQQTQPDMRYVWFRLDDGVTYIIIVEYEQDGNNPAAILPEYQAFMEILKVSIDGPPSSEQVTMRGSYRLFSS